MTRPPPGRDNRLSHRVRRFASTFLALVACVTLASAGDTRTVPLRQLGWGYSVATAFLPGVHSLVTTNNRYLSIVDADTGKFHGQILLPGNPSHIALAPDGTRAAVANAGGAIDFWDLSTGVRTGTLVTGLGSFQAMAWSPDSANIAAAGNDWTVHLWRVQNGSQQWVVGSHGNIESLQFSSDSTRLLTASNQETVILQTGDGSPYRSFPRPPNGIRTAAYSPSGHEIVVGSYGSSTVWDVESVTALHVLPATGEAVLACAYAPSGAWIVTCQDGPSVRLWDAATGQQLSYRRPGATPGAPSFSSDGARLVVGAGSGLDVLYLPSLALARSFGEHGYAYATAGVGFSPDGTRVFTASNTLQEWDAANGDLMRRYPGTYSGLASLAVSPAGDRIVTGSWDGSPLLWTLGGDTAATRYPSDCYATSSHGVSFSPDGTRLVVAMGELYVSYYGFYSYVGHGVVWSATNSPTMYSTLPRWDDSCERGILTAAWSPDGTLLATGGWDDQVNLWSATNYARIATLSGHYGNVTATAFSPDSRLLASGSADWYASDYNIKFWDTATGSFLRDLRGHTGGVTSLCFSPDGSLLLSGSWDGTARFWRTATGDPARILSQPGARFESVAFSPDGFTVVTGTSDGTALMWDATFPALNSGWVFK